MARYHRKSVQTPATIAIRMKKAMTAPMIGRTRRGQRSRASGGRADGGRADPDRKDTELPLTRWLAPHLERRIPHSDYRHTIAQPDFNRSGMRSEERRVGKE